MNVQQEYIKILTEVYGDQAVKNLEAELASLKAQAAALATQFQATGVMTAKMDEEMVQIASVTAKTKATIDALKGGGGGVSGQGVMGLSFAVQDFMSANGDLVQGLYRIQNNIPVLLAQLGVGAGLAGTISLVSLGIGALLPKIIELGKEFFGTGEKATTFKTYLTELQKVVDDFNKSQTGTATDVVKMKDAEHQLELLTKGEKAWETAIHARTKTEKETGNEVVNALTDLETKQKDIIESIAKKQSDAEVARRNQEIQARNQREEDRELEMAAIAGAGIEEQQEILETYRKRRGILQIDAKEREKIERELRARIGAIWDEALAGNAEQLDLLIQKLKDSGQKEVAVWLEQARDREKIQRENIDKLIANEDQYIETIKSKEKAHQEARERDEGARRDVAARVEAEKRAQEARAGQEQDIAEGRVQPEVQAIDIEKAIRRPKKQTLAQLRANRRMAAERRRDVAKRKKLAARTARLVKQGRRELRARGEPGAPPPRQLPGEAEFAPGVNLGALGRMGQRSDEINERLIRNGMQGLSLQERQLVASGKLLNMVQVLAVRMAATERKVNQFEQQVNRAPNGAQQQFLPHGGR